MPTTYKRKLGIGGAAVVALSLLGYGGYSFYKSEIDKAEQIGYNRAKAEELAREHPFVREMRELGEEYRSGVAGNVVSFLRGVESVREAHKQNLIDASSEHAQKTVDASRERLKKSTDNVLDVINQELGQ